MPTLEEYNEMLSSAVNDEGVADLTVLQNIATGIAADLDLLTKANEQVGKLQQDCVALATQNVQLFRDGSKPSQKPADGPVDPDAETELDNILKEW